MIFFLFFSASYLIIQKDSAILDPSIKILIYINTAIMIIQVTGTIPLFNSYQFYYPNVADWHYKNIFTDTIPYAPMNQWRPSGIFPSTIYLSACQILIIAYLYLKNNAVGNFTTSVLTLMLAVSASTASVLLAILVLLFGKNRQSALKFFLLYSFWLGLYVLFMPEFFIRINYSWVDLLRSLSTRLLESEDGIKHSAIAGYGIHLIILFFLAIVYAKFKRNSNLRGVTFFLILVVSPLVLHDFTKAAFYWFLLGLTYSVYYSEKRYYKPKSML